MLPRILRAVEYIRFRRVQYGSRAAIETWQQKHLRKLLENLYTNVPVFKEHLNRTGIRPGELRSQRDLERLPATNKSLFAGKFVEEYTSGNESSLGSWAMTSNPNGTPFLSIRNPHVSDVFFGDWMRYRALFEMSSMLFRADQLKIARILSRAVAIKGALVITIEEVEKHVESVFKKLVEFRPQVVESYPSFVYRLTRMSEGRGFTCKYALLSGEPVSDEVREYIKKTLSAEVFDRYYLQEFGMIGSECAEHRGIHLYEESFIVEVVNDAGEVLADGKEGRILITDLFNKKMPFVRYDTDDIGKKTSKICVCGLQTARLWITRPHPKHA